LPALLLLALAGPAAGGALSDAEAADAATGDEGARAALPPEVEAMIQAKEREAAATRAEGIALLEAFLADSPPSDETAEALFKLAELTWEEAQADYLRRMGAYQDQVTACKQDRARCAGLPPRPPRLDLSRAQSTYVRLIGEYPRFRKLDTVLYLLAFSLRDQGKLADAAGYFQQLLRDYPRSRFRADAWMALGEYRFYERQDLPGALRAYERVAKFPRSPLHGLALFKSAWCYWKMGQGDRAAQRFKDVLDLGKALEGKNPEERKRAAELQDQALDYLVQLFTEDDNKTAEDAYAFLEQIGGKAYSRRVLRRFADTVYDQTRYERAAHAYLFLIQLAPTDVEAPDFHRRVVESFEALGRGDRANAELRRLAVGYGPKSDWAKANADRPKAVTAARVMAEELVRNMAKGVHARAQRDERESKIVDKDRYAQAAEAYDFYLRQFPDAKDATELRYLRADILFFKLADVRGAGVEYLAVGTSKPPGPSHREALLQAMNAFEKLRVVKPAGAGPPRKREVTEDDRRFAEAADLYATLFPDDKEIVTVVYKNGQFFYDYGDFDEAVKRFGLIIERYPGSPVAGPAGDRLLECLGAARDYENIEGWARRLKKTAAFAGRKDQERLDGLIAGATLKLGEARAQKQDWAGAADLFERVAREHPGHSDAPTALNNAATAYEKAGRPRAAVGAYKALAEKYPRSPDAAGGLLVAARIEESIAAYVQAATLYELLATRFPRAPEAATALRSAGLLRQTLGQHDRAMAHYAEFEKQHRGKPEARQVAFQRALVFVEKKDAKGAAAAFADYAKRYPDDAHAIEALVREAEAHIKLGADDRAREALGRALAHPLARRRDEAAVTFAAEARYLQGELLYREYGRVKIAGRARQLARVLEDKARLLDEAKKVYLDVLTYRVPEWATAALLRVGQAYDAFAKALRATKVPRELGAEEQRLYRDELEKSVVVIEEKALDAYRSGYAKALELRVFNTHTRSLREALAELDQGEFPREVESRIGPRLGEPRTAALAPIEEIRRD
jgi:TolA-binding protein